MKKSTFRGFRRRRGRAGVRNDLWVIPTTACLNAALRSLLASYHKQYWIDAVRLLEHDGGCSELANGGRLWAVERALSSLVLHPNAAGVLVVGLGCEDFPMQSLMERVEAAGAGSVVQSLAYGAVSEGEILARLDKLGANAPRTREVFPFSHLCVGLVRRGRRCARNLPQSGLLERFAGWLTQAGGALLLAGEAERADAGDAFEYGRPVELAELVKLAEQVKRAGRRERVAAPASLPGALTSLAVSGAQILVCDSEAPAPFGAPVPTIRLCLNSNAEDRRSGGIDLDPSASGEPAKALADLLLSVAEGARTVSERENICGLAIDPGGLWRCG